MKFDNYYTIIYSFKKSENEIREGIFSTKFQYDGNNITSIYTKEIKSKVANKLKNLRAAKYIQNILITYI